MDDWGIQPEWVDAGDEPHRVPGATVDLLRSIIGTPPPDLDARAPVVTRPGRDLGPEPVQVVCEDGVERTVVGRIPDDFPLGYHRMRSSDGTSRRLIVSPGRCWLPRRRAWGWAVQLYAARSAASWGIGDLQDLRTLRSWTEGLGGGFLLVNPLHAVAPTSPQEPSPYLPASRRFRNPLYLRPDAVPGFEPRDVDLRALDELRTTRLVDRDGAWELKRAALRAAYDRAGGRRDQAFVVWRAAQGEDLEEFATWCALAETHGSDWREWPEPLRDPGGPHVHEFRETHPDEVGFHVWLQWQLDCQLRDATGELTVVQDLPIGVSGGGADAWVWQDVLADGVTVGAPPDALNSLGQDWGSPPPVPWRLRAADYEPFIQSVRRTIAGAGGLRIDHVMGLFRLWWVPQGHDPSDGAYVRYPSDDLLDIVALESHRAQAVVVGEDLGTVEPGVPEALRERRILSYQVLWFEEDEPSAWPEAALATVTTHDLPTVAGLWTGEDAADQVASTGMPAAEVREAREALLGRLTRHGLSTDAPVEEAVSDAYEQLAGAPSLLLSLSLEDAVLESQRPNMPGTVDRANWRIPLPLSVDDLVDSPEVQRLVRAVTRRD